MADNNNDKNEILKPTEASKNLGEPAIPSVDKATKGITGSPTLRNVIDVMQQNADKKEEAMQRKHKREQIINSIADGVSSLANLYFASKGAPSVQQTSLTEAAQKRYDKLAEDRRKKQAEMMDLYTKAYLADQQQANVDREYNRQVARDEADDAYRNSRAKVTDSQWRQSFERQLRRDNVVDKQWKMEYDHKQQQANVENSLRRQGLAIQQQDYNFRKQQYDDNNTYYMSVGDEIIAIPTRMLTNNTVAGIFNKIPEEKRKDYLKQRTTTDGSWKDVTEGGYENPSIDDMMYAIGIEAEGNRDIATKIKQLAGVNTHPTRQGAGAPTSRQGAGAPTYRRNTTNTNQGKRKPFSLRNQE